MMHPLVIPGNNRVLAACARVIYVLNGRRGTITQAREEDALVTFDEGGVHIADRLQQRGRYDRERGP